MRVLLLPPRDGLTRFRRPRVNSRSHRRHRRASCRRLLRRQRQLHLREIPPAGCPSAGSVAAGRLVFAGLFAQLAAHGSTIRLRQTATRGFSELLAAEVTVDDRCRLLARPRWRRPPCSARSPRRRRRRPPSDWSSRVSRSTRSRPFSVSLQPHRREVVAVGTLADGHDQVFRAILNSLPGTGTGLRRPLASISPSAFRTHSMPTAGRLGRGS